MPQGRGLEPPPGGPPRGPRTQVLLTATDWPTPLPELPTGRCASTSTRHPAPGTERRRRTGPGAPRTLTVVLTPALS